jgi:Domain of Unknown Function (DUF1080)
VRPAPEWNTIEVECAGPRITVRLNGQTVLEANQSELADVKIRPAGVPAPKDKPRSGYVALQSHRGRVEFRKAQIRELVIRGEVMTPVPFSSKSHDEAIVREPDFPELAGSTESGPAGCL